MDSSSLGLPIVFSVALFANVQPIASTACPTQCKCTAASIICSCQLNENFVLSEIPANHYTLSISNCKEVRIYDNPFNRLSLDRFTIQDSSEVHIADISFLGVTSIRRVKFSNIANLTLGSLYSLKADIFELNNVTIATLDKSVIPGIVDLKEVRITNSHIGTIMKGALHFQHEESIDIIDTIIAYADSQSICIDQVQTFTIRNCLITELAQDSMNLMHVGKVILSGNSIHTVSGGSFLADNIAEMVIVRNDFTNVEYEAFYHMQNVAKLTMASNRFLNVARHGLLLYVKVEDPSVIIENNQFICGCQLLWLYEELGYHKFDKFFNSTCSAPDRLAGLTLNDITPLMKNGKCLRFESIEERNAEGGTRESIVKLDPGVFNDSGAIQFSSVIMLVTAIVVRLLSPLQI